MNRPLILGAALVLAAAVGSATTALAIYSFGSDAAASPTKASNVYRLRQGDVALYGESATRCNAIRQAAEATLWCSRIGGGRRQVIFTNGVVQLWSLACRICAPGDPYARYAWRPKWAHPESILVPGVFLGGKYGLLYRPRNVVYTGDGSGYVDQLRYRTYGGLRAVAFGTRHVRSPRGPGFRYRSAPAHVTFWRLATCRGRRIYAMVTVEGGTKRQRGNLRPFTTDLRYQAACPVADFAR